MERCSARRRRKLAARSPGEPAPNSRSNTSRGLRSGGIGVVGDFHETL